MSAIFISYTGHDPEGDAWADLLVEWFSEWEYGYFRDRDHSHGIKAGGDWRQTLFAELADARVLVCLCSKQYDSSPWCVGEVAIAVKDGKTVIPIQLATTAKELKTEPLPLLLQTKQAIKVADAANPSPKQLEEVKEQLQTTLQQTLNWRDLLHWDRALAPYPGLPAFEEHQAPVFFGRDKTIEKVVERLAELALRSPAFLLLLGASGYGKSSLVRAGVVPRLKKDPEQEWLVLPPFMPGDEPFRELEAAVKEAGGVFHSADPLGSIRELQRQGKRTLVVVIDQFEELLTAGPKAEGQDDQGEAFQVFLLQLLRSRKARLLVVATMRTDFLAPLQARWPALTGMATTITLEPIEPEDFGELITGPADRSSLSLEAGLTARLVKDSGGRDALPLLAFTLEKLWKARDGQVLTVKAYEDLKGVAGAVSTRAEECWNPQTSSEEVRQALREAFLDYLVSVSGDGQEAKRPAPLAELPIASREIVQRMVDDRLLVQKDGIVEIAHEALLRTWEPLVKWIEEGKEELLQCLRVKHLCEDLNPEAPERQRRQALEQLAALAASGGSEQRAVKKEASETLSNLISNNDITVADRKDVAVVLALIGSVQPLRDCLAAPDVPPILQQRIAESLGLLAAHCKNTMTTVEIQKDLAEWLESDPIDMLIRTEEDWEEHDARLPFLQGVSRGIQIAASAGLPMLGSGPGQTLPMLSICAKEESGALNIRSEIVTASVWKLPLPDGEWLELVEVPRGKYAIGSLPTDREHEKIRKSYIAERAGCESCDVEALRTVSTDAFMISRFPISRRQWSSVVNNIESIDVALDESPGTGWPAEIWDKTAEPGGMAVNYISWHECREWLHRLNNWITRKWPALGGLGSAPKLYLPSEAQWEVACRAGKNDVFHFGDTLDYKWARYDSSYAYGLGRRADKKWSQQGINGAFGLVNSFGLADLHGQVFEWCADSWHPNPIGLGWREDGQPWADQDSYLLEIGHAQAKWKPLRGGSWISGVLWNRASMRFAHRPEGTLLSAGFRPTCIYRP